MNRHYPLIVGAVAAALGAGFADAGAPSIGQAASPAVSLVMAGSSAAKNAISSGLATDVCGGSSNMLTVTSAPPSGGSGSKNFFAYSCFTAKAISTIPANTLLTVYYRDEGGSVVGALPLVSGVKILRLNLSDPSCAGTSCTVSGLTATAGPVDGWTGAVTEDYVQLGVTDVEPGQLTGTDYPTNYSPAKFGTASAKQLAALPTTKLFQQVFGLAVNTSGESFSTVNLTKESAANILSGNYSDWSAVPDALTGAPISSGSAGITLVNREAGSGTRTATNIEFFHYQCGSSNSLNDGTPASDSYSTTDELNLANSTPGSIAYASIDQLLDPHNSVNFPNLVLATIDGVTPSNLAAATGAYDYWFEATLVPNPSTSILSGNSLLVANYLETTLPKLAYAPQEPDINVIPNLSGNVAAVPIASSTGTHVGSGTAEIYVNPYTRAGNSCNVPSETN